MNRYRMPRILSCRCKEYHRVDVVPCNKSKHLR